MTLRVRPFFTWGCLVAWVGMSPVLAAGVSCESWNTAEFFDQGGAEDISRCLKTRSPNERDEDGMTPLHWAALFSTTPAVVAALVKAGADVNARGEGGATPLHAAAGYNTTPAVVAALVNAGADVNVRDEDGWTPLHWAAGYSTTPAVVTALVTAGADVNARDELGVTPLHAAALLSTTSAVVAALLANGADPAARTTGGDTPWDWIKDDSPLKGTDVYWELNEGRFR